MYILNSKIKILNDYGCALCENNWKLEENHINLYQF